MTTQVRDKRDSLTTFSKHFVHPFDIIGHNNTGSETVNSPENGIKLDLKMKKVNAHSEQSVYISCSRFSYHFCRLLFEETVFINCRTSV